MPGVFEEAESLPWEEAGAVEEKKTATTLALATAPGTGVAFTLSASQAWIASQTFDSTYKPAGESECEGG